MRRIVFVGFFAACASGCGTTAPSHFYTLDSTATADGAPSGRYTVMVEPVSIPASVDRPQFVVQVAPNRVEIEEFDRWAAPLSESIARVVAGNLVALLGTPQVLTAPIANYTPDYRVSIDVQRFESVRAGTATVDAVWAVQKKGGGPPRSGRTVATEPVQGDGFEALAAGHSRALATLSSDIAAAIRAANDTTR